MCASRSRPHSSTARQAILATSPDSYLAGLPDERRAALARVRAVINDNLPEGYQESGSWGISWEIPLSRYADTYNGKPMCVAALASHTSTATLYLMGPYVVPELRDQLERGFKAAGKRLDMGKSCVHFTSADDLPLDIIGDVIAALPAEVYIARIEAANKAPRARRARLMGTRGPKKKTARRATTAARRKTPKKK